MFWFIIYAAKLKRSSHEQAILFFGKFNEMFFAFYVNSIWEHFWVELNFILSASKGKRQVK